MANYSVKNPVDLSDEEIRNILDAWEVEEWKNMKPEEFRNRFIKSEFHLLTENSSRILSVARINFNFKVKIEETTYPIAELVGFVSVVILEGHGKTLLKNIAENLNQRQIEAIGFSRKRTAKFYESSGFKLLYDKVQFLRERKDDQWFTPTEDDHIISLSLTDSTLQLFENLSTQNPAYLLFE
jgi:hypothetical protein